MRKIIITLNFFKLAVQIFSPQKVASLPITSKKVRTNVILPDFQVLENTWHRHLLSLNAKILQISELLVQPKKKNRFGSGSKLVHQPGLTEQLQIRDTYSVRCRI